MTAHASLAPVPSIAPVVSLRRTVPFTPVQGTLALDLGFEEALTLGPHDDPRAVIRLEQDGEPVRRLHRDGEQWARRYLQAAVEIVGGARPASQLVRWTTREVHADLGRRAQLVARANGRTTGEHGAPAVLPAVMSLHPHTVRRGVLEVAARIRYGQRSRALAARFELRADRWICTALDFA